MVNSTCTADGCDDPCGRSGLCKRHYRQDYYRRNRDRERARSAAWRAKNYDYDRRRWAIYADQRWGDERASRQAAREDRVAATEKECTSCGEVKAGAEFYKDRRRIDGLYSWCKTCFLAHTSQHRDSERERERQRERWATDPGYRAARLVDARAYKLHRYYTDEAYAQHCRDAARQWAKDHPERASLNAREAANVRRARMLDQSDGPVDYAAVLAEHGMHCHICDKPIGSFADLHMDHVLPLSKGGRHHETNLRPAHVGCNLRKGAKLIG